MRTKMQPASTYLAALSAFIAGGCQHLDYAERIITLDGFSDRNYTELDEHLGESVCIRGRLSIDSTHHSVHFALRPIQDGNIITIGFSRIISGLSYDYVRRHGMVDGARYRVCGTLRDATPFRQCNYNDCKWYRLENSRT